MTDRTRRGTRLNAGVQRRVQAGARARADLAIKGAIAAREGVYELPEEGPGGDSYASQFGNFAETIRDQGIIAGMKRTGVEPVTVDGGQWVLDPISRQQVWRPGGSLRLQAAQSGVSPASTPPPTPTVAGVPAQFGRTTTPQRVDPQASQSPATAGDLRGQMAASERDAREYADIIRQHSAEIDELNAQQLQAIQDGAMEIAAQYDEKIDELKGRIADARVGLKRSMAAFQHYASQVAPAFEASVEAAVAGQAAQQEALAGRGAEIEAKIAAGVDAETEDVEDFAELVGTDNQFLSDGLRASVGKFEDMVADAARGRIEDVDRISAAAAKFATAQAEAIQAQDEFLTDVDKEKIRISIQSQIDDMLDNVADLERDKADAVQAALDRYDPMSADFESADEAWAFVLNEYILSQGWSMEEEDIIRGLMGSMDGVTNRAEAEAWLKANVYGQERLSALEEYLVRHYGGEREVPELYVPYLQAIAADPESDAAARAIEFLRQSLQIGEFDQAFVKNMMRDATGNYGDLLEVFDMYAQHTKRWNEARAATAGSGLGQGGVNNYANRNDPQYVRRRDVGVPAFVNNFLAAFNKQGTGRQYVGGVTSSYRGALRSPSMTGGGRASDSDHLSGGAIDLYGATVAELEAIERWAINQPGVASVVYSGNKYHETGIAGGSEAGNNGRGHVHVSLAIGYW